MVTTIPWLSMLWLLPAVAAVVTALLPVRSSHLARYLPLAASLLVLVVAVTLALRFEPGGERYQFVESHAWIPAFGIRYLVGLDGIALALVLLTAVLVPLLLIAGWHDGGGHRRGCQVYAALILAVEAMVLMSLVALDLVLFYVFFEAMLIPMYFLIGRFGSGRAPCAAMKFLLYNLFGGLVMLAAVIGLYAATADSGTGSFDLRQLVIRTGSVEPQLLALLFLGFMFAFAVKAPMWPLHSWLPGVAQHAKPVTAVLMMAVVDKLGTFAMLRYCLQLFPDTSKSFAPFISTLAIITIIYSAIVAIGQTDVMRLIAYTSISHYGFIVLGIFAMTSQGQSGSALYMVNHGIATAALMLIAGFLVSQRGTGLIAAYGGVQRVAPVLAGTFLVAGLASLSLPGLASFISEFLVLIGTFIRYPILAVFASTALVLSAVYILWMYQRMMTGPVKDGNDKLRDLLPREILVVAPLIALLIVLGIYPKPALDVINPAVDHTLSVVGANDPAPVTAQGVPR
jgi:NADH-quinone oxidoreductase subunit M